jgi:hypothetical protein
MLTVAIGLLVLLITAGAVADWWIGLPQDAAAGYVGRQSCIQCHQQEAKLWQGSHHDLAMDRATSETVLGDFNDAKLEHYGITSTMYREDDKFMVNTEGPDGEMADFEVKYVLGVEPLQQYMVEFDRSDGMPPDEVGRLQVLRVSWDTGGRKWFYLRPPDVDEKLDPHDELHWTGVAQRWNNMCADCHTTNLQKNFDDKTAKYQTTFSEIDVSCEACHGPGSLHVEIAQTKGLFWDRHHGYGLAKLKDKHSSKAQLDTCFQCHSRRSRIVKPEYRPGTDYYEHFGNELLVENTYFADGQVMDEVYVHGSFIQSKMYHKNIRCTDCHDPHTARLKHDGNKVCTSCHEHPAGKYDSPAHHRHNTNGKGASCVECHMPETTYMAVDPRRDHSLRVPRPDLSVQLGTPNACTRCHLDRAKIPPARRADFTQYLDWMLAARDDAEVRSALATVDKWAADHCNKWYGEKQDKLPHFANVLAAARQDKPEVENELAAFATNKRLPGIVRATCLQELARFGRETAIKTSVRLLEDDDIQVRSIAVANLQILNSSNQRDVKQLIRLLVPFLEDPAGTVRVEATRVLAFVPPGMLDGQQRRTLRSSIREFEASLMSNSDRAGPHLVLGSLHEFSGNVEAARKAYETAMRVEPRATFARKNLAALLDRQAEEAEAEVGQLARTDRQQAIERAIEAQKLRQRAGKLREEELVLLQRDVRLAPENAGIQYEYGLALYNNDRNEEAEKALARAVELSPNTAQFVGALGLLYHAQKRYSKALPYLERVLELQPDDEGYRRLLEEVRKQAASESGPQPNVN